MTSITDDYLCTLKDFIEGRLSVSEFEASYLAKFKNEVREMDELTFEVLDSLFGDVDAFTDDSALLSENPEFYIDENQLRSRVSQAISQLK